MLIERLYRRFTILKSHFAKREIPVVPAQERACVSSGSNVRPTVISQTRNSARALAKERECRSGMAENIKRRSQRPPRNLELLGVAYASW